MSSNDEGPFDEDDLGHHSLPGRPQALSAVSATGGIPSEGQLRVRCLPSISRQRTLAARQSQLRFDSSSVRANMRHVQVLDKRRAGPRAPQLGGGLALEPLCAQMDGLDEYEAACGDQERSRSFEEVALEATLGAFGPPVNAWADRRAGEEHYPDRSDAFVGSIGQSMDERGIPLHGMRGDVDAPEQPEDESDEEVFVQEVENTEGHCIEADTLEEEMEEEEAEVAEVEIDVDVQGDRGRDASHDEVEQHIAREDEDCKEVNEKARIECEQRGNDSSAAELPSITEALDEEETYMQEPAETSHAHVLENTMPRGHHAVFDDHVEVPGEHREDLPWRASEADVSLQLENMVVVAGDDGLLSDEGLILSGCMRPVLSSGNNSGVTRRLVRPLTRSGDDVGRVDSFTDETRRVPSPSSSRFEANTSDGLGRDDTVPSEMPLAEMPVRIYLHMQRTEVGGRPRSPRSDNVELGDDHSGSARGDASTELWQEVASWQVADELGTSGSISAPRFLVVRLGESIPAETSAAPVYLSRLEAGTQWREFLDSDGPRAEQVHSLDDVLKCPCCLATFHLPVALPCGHNLCRGCLARLRGQAPSKHRCPLCRALLPRMELKVNLALAAVCDALRTYRAGPPRMVA